MATFEKRMKKNGEYSYRATVRIKGFKETSATFPTEKEAEEWAFQTEKSFKSRKLEFTPSLNNAIERYTQEVLPNKTLSQQTDEMPHLKYWETHLGEKILKEITTSEIEDIANEIYKIISKKTKLPLTYESRRKYLMTLSYLYNTAIKQWRWINSNPVAFVNKHVPSSKKEHVKISITDSKSIGFYNKIDEVMARKNIGVTKLAKKIPCSLSTLQNCLNRKTNITFHMMVKICNALDLTCDFVVKD